MNLFIYPFIYVSIYLFIFFHIYYYVFFPIGHQPRGKSEAHIPAI